MDPSVPRRRPQESSELSELAQNNGSPRNRNDPRSLDHGRYGDGSLSTWFPNIAYKIRVACERLRIVMSSIMRWRRGLVVAIGASCPERGRCDDHILSGQEVSLE